MGQGRRRPSGGGVSIAREKLPLFRPKMKLILKIKNTALDATADNRGRPLAPRCALVEIFSHAAKIIL